MKKVLSLALASALTLAFFTSCTIHVKLDDKGNNTSSANDYSSDYDYDDDYDYDYDYDYNRDDSSYGEKVDASTIQMKDSTEDNPLKVGEWGKAMSYTSSDPDYSEVGVTVTELIRGDEARQMIIDAGYDEDDLDKKLDDGNEWVVLKYKVYCPEDFPTNSFMGFYYSFVSLYPFYYSGNYKYTCFGTDISHYDIDDYKASYIYNGEVGEGLYAFSVAKDVKDVYVQFGSDPDYTDDVDEGYAYFVIQ